MGGEALGGQILPNPIQVGQICCTVALGSYIFVCCRPDSLQFKPTASKIVVSPNILWLARGKANVAGNFNFRDQKTKWFLSFELNT
ncbi:hypothetical protein QQP08_019179 [Theobroma cacao]|uniref:Uncharacterized protein n=1 Tax=Theobroma cacao TaxID=3641 RepID=A0A061GLQ7_THECC|nr:Uncharacterized protein TCM_029713 [Theobroma cacao]WRX26692.1 hypothetical protein QQP08_019179 [Theobroma cacao]